ncbi:hypothetical protein V8D89_006566 [Ganoderma adspersum]
MSESASTHPAPPYLDPSSTGDLIIRTPDPDSTRFHVHQCIIANLSPVFADMFSLPNHDAASPDKPIVDVQESATLWTHVLSFCYLGPRPSSLAIDDVHALLEAARKYQMPSVTDWMRRTLADEFVDTQPLSAFGLACAYKLDDVARRAARASLFLPADFDFVKELDLIPTHQYHRLLEYRRRCLRAARAVLLWENPLKCPSWLDDTSNTARYNRVFYTLQPRNKSGQNGPSIGEMYRINDAWRTGMEQLCKNIETQLRPSSTFCPLLLAPLIRACGSASNTEDAATIASRAQDFALLLDAEIERVVNEVELELDK